MKTTAMFVCVGALIVAGAFTAQAATVKYIIGDGGGLEWNGKVGDYCDCPEKGAGCKIEVTMEVGSIVSLGGGWEVTG